MHEKAQALELEGAGLDVVSSVVGGVSGVGKELLDMF
jgi:hypothetical protein